MIYYFIAIMMAIAVSACSNDSDLKKMVKTFNEICPISAGDWLTMEKADYKDNTVILTYTVSEDLIDFEGIKANEESFRRNTLIGYANNTDEGFLKLLDAIIKADADMEIVMNSKNGESYNMHFSAEELKENRAGDNADPEILLNTIADNARLQTPQKIDEGMFLTDVLVDEKYYIYVYSCDEPEYDIESMCETESLMKDVLKNDIFGSNDPILKKLLDLIKETNRGIAYRFVGSPSGKTYTLYFEPNEIF